MANISTRIVQMCNYFATTYFMTSIMKKDYLKCKKCDWSIKRDFCNKNSVQIPKNDKFDFCFKENNLI